MRCSFLLFNYEDTQKLANYVAALHHLTCTFYTLQRQRGPVKKESVRLDLTEDDDESGSDTGQSTSKKHRAYHSDDEADQGDAAKDKP
jgi:hypothetical protein